MNFLPVPDAPLSFAQSRIWLLNQLTGPDAQYNVPLVVRFQEKVCAEAMRASLRDVAARHEILRTVYQDVGGRPRLAVCEPDSLPELIDVEVCPEPERDERANQIAQREFDLAEQLPIRACLLTGGPSGDVLVIVIHHIAVDESSLEPLLKDLSTAYLARRAGKAPRWQPLRQQYRDFAVSQRRLLGDARDPDSLAARQLAYWASQLAGLPEETPLQVDRPRPPDPDTRGATVLRPVPAEVRLQLLELARTERVAPLTLFKAALAAFLHCQGAGDDIPLAGVVTGRFDGSLDDQVGFFVNTLVFRIDTSGAPSFRELLRRVGAVDLDAYSHQDVPFDEVVRVLNPPRSAQRHPIAQVAISFRGQCTYAVPGLDAIAELGQNPRVKFDLQVCIVDTEQTSFEWLYPVALFDAVTVESLAREFGDFLACLLRDPDRSITDAPA